jgi:uncharacterized protein (TIGR02246 family)
LQRKTRESNSETGSSETAVWSITQEEIAAWNSGDATVYSRHFADDGTFTSIRGQFFTGRQALIDRHDSFLRDHTTAARSGRTLFH